VASQVRVRAHGETALDRSVPSVGVAEAREAVANAKAKRLLREGKDPAVEKRLRRLQVVTDGGTTFEAIAREWHSINKGHWVEQHAYDVLHSLERDVFPALGSIPIKSITAANVLSVLRTIENRPAAETARRIRQRMSAVFVYAIASGRAENDPASAVQKAMKPVKKGRSRPSPISSRPEKSCLVQTRPRHHRSPSWPCGCWRSPPYGQAP
jgi:hypothetical protein